MVKIWGYDDGQRRPGGMYATQAKRVDSTGKISKLIMRIPDTYDIQRNILARQLMYLSRPEVRLGKSMYPKEFEQNLAKFKRQDIDKKVTGPRGGLRRNQLRKKRVMQPGSKRQDVKWDIKDLSYIGVLPDISKDYWQKYQKTSQKDKLAERKKREEEEAWQRRNWLSKFIRDLKSERVNEILSNCQMVTSGTVGVQGQYNILLESARYALKTHNWALISQSLCGMVERYCTHQYIRRSSSALGVFWTLGFFTLTNHYIDDITKVQEFAKNVHKLLGGHPFWVTSQLAVWLLQKGYFMAAYRVIDDNSFEKIHPKSLYRTATYGKQKNPKRDMAVFLTSLITAVYHYCVWRKETTMADQEIEDGNEANVFMDVRRDDLRRKGELALGIFEQCYISYKAVNGDAMCFLEPFIELVVEYRSVARAREIMEEVFNLNDGNYFVEKFFVEFLEEHYADSQQDLIDFLKKRTQRKFNHGEDDYQHTKHMKTNGKRQMRQWKEQRRKSIGEQPPTMKKISNPAFSW